LKIGKCFREGERKLFLERHSPSFIEFPSPYLSAGISHISPSLVSFIIIHKLVLVTARSSALVY
jgi:hypothetical protein